jgi:hypothetical protein
MSSQTLLRRAISAWVLIALSVGCSDTPPGPEETELPDLRAQRLPEPVIRDLLKLRKSLVKYERFERAVKDGFDTPLTGCMVMPPQGGMGFHYGKASIIDAIPNPTAPEVLLYQPLKGGKKRLVGVEFIVPFDLWTKPEPPVLYGQVMRPNHTFGLWTLHVWLFKHNKNGLFADWNPDVRC